MNQDSKIYSLVKTFSSERGTEVVLLFCEGCSRPIMEVYRTPEHIKVKVPSKEYATGFKGVHALMNFMRTAFKNRHKGDLSDIQLTISDGRISFQAERFGVTYMKIDERKAQKTGCISKNYKKVIEQLVSSQFG